VGFDFFVIIHIILITQIPGSIGRGGHETAKDLRQFAGNHMQLFMCCDGERHRFYVETLGRLLDRYVGQQAIPVKIVLNGTIEVLSGGKIVLTGDEVWWYHLPGIDVGFAHPEVQRGNIGFKSLLIRFTHTNCDEEAVIQLMIEIVDKLRKARCEMKMAKLRDARKKQLIFADMDELHTFVVTATQALLVNARGDKATEFPLLPVRVG
jgi:hypothetical protein